MKHAGWVGHVAGGYLPCSPGNALLLCILYLLMPFPNLFLVISPKARPKFLLLSAAAVVICCFSIGVDLKRSY